jgi:hypothetical protein
VSKIFRITCIFPLRRGLRVCKSPLTEGDAATRTRRDGVRA